ncbi:C40 family peptidase, partial [Enterococcus lactis]|uniref:C40 family peptidase n=1 Tax=Enterococcus lactis TaxID=357441 RepID=UPI0039A73F04
FGTVLPLVGETADSYQVATPNGPATIAKAFAHVLSDTWAKLPEKIIALAEQFINQPYVWAGISGSGFDCSGFMYSLHRLHGILIPRDTIEQAQQAKTVPYSQAQPGDLLLFAYEEGKGEVHHVGLYLGDDEMIHSRTPGSRVMKTKITGSNYEPELAVVARYWQNQPNASQECS